MSNGQPYIPKPGTNERLVVEEMLSDLLSKHWEETRNLVKQYVYAKAKNIPSNIQEDIVQEVMYKVMRYLPHFRFQCTLKTWLNQIIEGCIIDVHRKLKNERQYFSMLPDAPNEGEEVHANEVISAEDSFETNSEIRAGLLALLEYAKIHANPSRNRLIIKLVILEGQTHEAAAFAAGCSAPVVGYVIREAQRYAREKTDR